MKPKRLRELAHDLDKYRGQWVAIKEGKVVASSESVANVIRQLDRRGIKGAGLFRVALEPNQAIVLSLGAS